MSHGTVMDIWLWGPHDWSDFEVFNHTHWLHNFLEYRLTIFSLIDFPHRTCRVRKMGNSFALSLAIGSSFVDSSSGRVRMVRNSWGSCHSGQISVHYHLVMMKFHWRGDEKRLSLGLNSLRHVGACGHHLFVR
jgi:hypothetical protein